MPTWELTFSIPREGGVKKQHPGSDVVISCELSAIIKLSLSGYRALIRTLIHLYIRGTYTPNNQIIAVTLKMNRENLNGIPPFGLSRRIGAYTYDWAGSFMAFVRPPN